MIGADGIRSQVRRQLFSDQPPSSRASTRTARSSTPSTTHGLPSDGNLRMYLGHGTKVYFLPLLHRGQVSFDVTALNADSTPNPQATKEDLLAHGRRLRRADHRHAPAIST